MMMSERWPDPQSGLLLYLRNSSITEIQAGIHEVRGLVQLRNQLLMKQLQAISLEPDIVIVPQEQILNLTILMVILTRTLQPILLKLLTG